MELQTERERLEALHSNRLVDERVAHRSELVELEVDKRRAIEEREAKVRTQGYRDAES